MNKINLTRVPNSYWSIAKLDAAMPKNDNLDHLGITSSYDSAELVCADDYRYSMNLDNPISPIKIESLNTKDVDGAEETYVLHFNRRLSYIVKKRVSYDPPTLCKNNNEDNNDSDNNSNDLCPV